MLCPESFWGSSSRAVNFSRSCCCDKYQRWLSWSWKISVLGLENQHFGLAMQELGVGAASPRLCSGTCGNILQPQHSLGSSSVPRRAQPSLGKQKGLTGCSVTDGIPGLCFSLGTFPGWCHAVGNEGTVPGHGDMDALLIFPLRSCSLPCSWVSFTPHSDRAGQEPLILSCKVSSRRGFHHQLRAPAHPWGHHRLHLPGRSSLGQGVFCVQSSRAPLASPLGNGISTAAV